jgi:hypothetical protein
MLAFLIGRVVLLCIFGCKWITKYHKIKESKEGDSAVTQCFSLSSFGTPVLVSLGAYRILPSVDFPSEIKYGYAIEVTTSMIPIMILQFINNGEHTTGFTWLQTACLTLRLFAFINWFIEFFL